MGSHKRAVFRYDVEEEDINKILDRVRILRDARDSIIEEFPSMECRVFKDPTFVHHSYRIIIRETSEAQEGELENALKHFFSKAGLPDWVYKSSNLEYCKRVFREYGKTLERGWLARIVGSELVDI